MSTVPDQLLSLVPESLQPIVANYWQDWSAAGDKADLGPAVDLSLMGRIWASSDFVARLCIRRPEMLKQLAEEGFARERTAQDYQQLVAQAIAGAETTEQDLMRVLRRLRQQEMVRIAWRDLGQLAPVETILQELTDLAVAMVSVTLHALERQQAEIFGMPLDSNGNEQALLVFDVAFHRRDFGQFELFLGPGVLLMQPTCSL
jgi:glutamate-ammonia-ligase adenylyltransferase